MTEVINQIKYGNAKPLVNFTWSPSASTPISQPSVSVTSTPHGQAITFTASLTVPNGVNIVRYVWDMGDGTALQGSQVVHTFQIANFAQIVKLTVIDQFAQRYSVSRPIYLT